jgi:hypothetical protein
MSNDPNDFLMGGGGKAFKFEQLTDTVSGTITDATVSQQTSLEDNTPLTWSDGSPRMQLVVTLATDQHEDDNDDGLRRIYAKGGKFEVAEGSGAAMKDAIADAVRRSGAKRIEEGGKLTVAFTGKGKATNRGYSAPKLFKAKYEPPTRNVAVDDLFD